LLIGVIEELSKAFLLTVFIYKKKYFEEVTDGIIYFGIAGMMFGVLESIEYTLRLGDSAGLGKIITGPFSHASFTAMIGFCIARYKLEKKGLWIVAVGLVSAIGLHALYDFGLFTQTGWGFLGSMAITIGINLGIFGLFALAKRIDERRGISTVGHNLYCRNCGWPNRKHFVYCVSCGQKT
jgi:RsiW-degrading membrane proteinase PrsW (M82 family)